MDEYPVIQLFDGGLNNLSTLQNLFFWSSSSFVNNIVDAAHFSKGVIVEESKEAENQYFIQIYIEHLCRTDVSTSS